MRFSCLFDSFFFFSKTKVTVKGLSFLELNTLTIKWVKICDSVQCDSVTVSRDVRPFFDKKNTPPGWNRQTPFREKRVHVVNYR